MVFSSIPVFVDPPNWQQQPNNHPQANNNGGDNTQLLPPLPPHQSHVGGSVGSIRPGSMADRARLAKLPPPEAALKCPRCDSTNTKFCYFNNYSLSQPRHFCKTCRRYWTRGGALRNVPVGGGCRRNKKNKRSSRSKSPASSEKQQTLSGSTSAIVPSGGTTHEQIGHQLPQPQNLPFLASLQNLNRYAVGNMGLGLREIHGQNENMGFQIGNSSAGGGMDQWRLHQQVPFFNGFESTSAGSYPFQNEGINETPSGFGGDITTNSRVSQMPSVKMEESGALNLSRSTLNNVSENNQYYSWTDMSGLASFSATHLL
ncbi:hypothetical protein AAZX31_11G136600 [Glycine max]|uniref:Dof zinc finger protein n=1 Tax=Glycine soja TaxID=3848 RepID=A0A445I1I1_GLYSO|nr:dof zinc finger protein DOF3.6 [Glycine max]XP_028187972.1 dof zinc finger protein DOF3.6-like [Glycine soja]KAG4386870.1 hypothetical protein GLYMA_11G140200v4 [Glycine max]KAG4974028.1 hypothetical protein JHK87_030849 [Glycine soja]KAG4988600.1 hypothetical protein JHK85_031583 [Glycine max]KAG4994206.1 hypothetical protein JHK86_031033 [Glycine max]KAG5124199.1 hypothetical protein JHK82_030936 [Glycine max]